MYDKTVLDTEVMSGEGYPVEATSAEKLPSLDDVKNGGAFEVGPFKVKKNKADEVIMTIAGKEVGIPFPEVRKVALWALEDHRRLNGVTLESFLIAFALKMAEVPTGEEAGTCADKYQTLVMNFDTLLEPQEQVYIASRVGKAHIDWDKVKSEADIQ